MADTAKTRKEVEEQLVAKAWADEGFRKRLVADPKRVLGEMGFSVRDTVKVSVLEETPNQVYVVVPRQKPQASAGSDLSDEALEGVSGGFFSGSCFSCGGG